ncbi:MAG TPA: MFS transporter, partial [Candidatus Limnocylindrales bacterium]|nr:MFS transporter [Candidatus Limnocylindrales bacterium]
RFVLLVTLALGAGLTGLELMVTATALPTVVRDLADWTRLREASWIVNGYLLTYAAAMPLAGGTADRYALPPLFLTALAIFAAGSLLAGAAPSLEWLIGARLLQGIGGGAVVPLARAGASHLYDGQARDRALGLVEAATYLGMAAGPFVGATILTVADLTPFLQTLGPTSSAVVALLAPSWRWCFYLGAPAAALVAVYAWAAAPAWPAQTTRAGLDVPGAAYFTIALAAVLVALTWLGAPDALGTPAATVGLLVVALAALGLALLRGRRMMDPFIDLGAFRQRPFTAATLVSLLTGYALATGLIGAAVFVDRVLYGGPDDQRLVLGPLALAMALGALGAGFGLRRLGARWVGTVGLVVGAAGLGLVGLAGPTTPELQVAGALVIFGLGFGLSVTPRSSAAVETLGRRAFGRASADVAVARDIGLAVGLAVLAGFGSNRIQALSVVLTDQAARDAVLPAALQGHDLQDPFVVDVLERWAAGQAAGILAGIFLVAAAVMLLAIVPALAMEPRQRRASPGDPSAGSGEPPAGSGGPPTGS